MRSIIKHESDGRMRVHLDIKEMSLAEADVLEYYLLDTEGVTGVRVYDRTCDVVISYDDKRDLVIDSLAHFSFDDINAIALVPERTCREMDRVYQMRMVNKAAIHYLVRFLMPYQVRTLIAIVKALKYVSAGLKSLWKGGINVDLLDATAITVSIIRGDSTTASSIMFLLGIGDLLEEWAHKKSVDDLAGMMALNVDKVWRRADGKEELVPVSEVLEGDVLVVRSGGLIPLDGKVVDGEAMVNQSTMTGESMPVIKHAGSYVYGGTVVEEGSCVYAVDKAAGDGRYDRIVRMIEESERLKSATESRAANLADKLVPYSLTGTLLAYAITQNAERALSFLMVDYSCALKLTMPLAVLSAMKESSRHKISVKGGKFLELVSQSDTLVFDKTGTLTHATPTVADVIPFGGSDADEMLRIAACLEEHYPHSMANAVVKAAADRGLVHEEMHSSVEYVVAHGITSTINGARASIGSRHFIFDDEKTEIAAEDRKRFEDLPTEYSLLYLSIDSKLAAVICIDDPVRDGMADVISHLKSAGFRNIVMMTGDSEKTAAHVAGKLGIDEFASEVLPEDKANYIKDLRAKGHKVIMIGDGINDSPALSEADVGIAVNSGAAIAKEISDITIESDDLASIITLREISNALMDRIHGDYRFIMTFNSALIVLGVAGILTPATSALLHNASTLVISSYNMTNLITE